MICGFISIILALVSLFSWRPYCIISLIFSVAAIIEMCVWISSGTIEGDDGIGILGWILLGLSLILSIISLIVWMA